MPDRFRFGAVRGQFNRRQVLKVSALGAGGSVLAGLLAACGSSSSSPTTSAATSAATSATGGSGQTPTPQVLPTAQVNTGAASPAATPKAAGSATAASTSASAGTPKKGGDFVIVGHQEIAGLSPNDTGPGDQWVMITQIHNALVEMDENSVFNPVLAEKFDVAPDSLTSTFHLR
ncbi:MAG TPA: hypothetical protein VFU78_22855, partial [Thermomicrobiales bacterium]|nr:hypothetical protein [Thermomicrobiales bacterium]